MLHGKIFVLLQHFLHILWQPVFIVVWIRISDLISLALHSNLHVPINMESAFRLLPTRLDAVSVWILTRLLPPCSLHKTNSMLPILAAQCYSLSLLHDPRLLAELTRQSSTGKVGGPEKQSGGNVKRSQGGVGVVLSLETAAGWLFIHALSSSRLSVVSFPSCMKNEFSNASEPKKLRVPVLNTKKEWQCHFWLQAETQLFSLKPK